MQLTSNCIPLTTALRESEYFLGLSRDTDYKILRRKTSSVKTQTTSISGLHTACGWSLERQSYIGALLAFRNFPGSSDPQGQRSLSGSSRDYKIRLTGE